MANEIKLSKSYQSLINNISSGIVILDQDKNIVYWNRWFCQYSNMKLEKNQYKKFSTVFPGLENSRTEEAIKSALELGYPSLVSNIFSRTPFPLYKPSKITSSSNDNERIQQSVNVARIELDGANFCLIQINDVTASVTREKSLEQQVKERKLIEEALLKSEIRHRSIMETMIDGLIVFGCDGIIESFNPAAERIFSHSETDILGKNIGILFEDVCFTESPKTVTEILLNLDLIGKSKECVGIKRDSSTFPIELSVSKMSLGKEIYYSAVVRDISERKKVDKLQRDFIATVSHELRTPLTSIRGSLGLLLGGVVAEVPQKAHNLIEIATKNCERLILLINDILDMEKANSGKIQFNLEPHDVNKLIDQAITINESYAKDYNINYRVVEMIDGIQINVDEHRFQQIMSNLLSNAAKFSEAANDVEISVKAKRDFVEIDVKDYGVGIPVEFQENIWNKFSQADTSNTREKGGTGLGLAISKSLCEAMRGNISFTSNMGEGTVFHLRLPIAS